MYHWRTILIMLVTCSSDCFAGTHCEKGETRKEEAKGQLQTVNAHVRARERANALEAFSKTRILGYVRDNIRLQFFSFFTTKFRCMEGI